MSSIHYENQLLDAIDTMVNNAVARAEYDKTIRAIIQECLDETTGKYRVKYQDSIFEAYASNSSIKYANNTQVYILIPKNDMSQNKVILHAVNTETPEYAMDIKEQLYETVDSNTVGQGSFELCSYNGKSIITLYDRDNNINVINFNSSAFEESLKKGEGFCLGADFKTALPEEQQRKGNYGIICEIDFTNTITGESITRVYTLDINNMEGNPYALNVETSQKANFELDIENFKSVKSLTIFAKNFPKTENGKDTDIFISNFQLLIIRTLSQGYSLIVKTDKSFFDKEEAASDSITATSLLYLNGEPVDEKLEYYWCKQNNNIDTNSDKYIRYAGMGWECLNETITIDSEEDIIQYITDKNELMITKSDCEALENYYKLVAVSNNLIMQKEFIIKNYGANYALTIQSDEGQYFSYENGSPTLTVLVNGKEDINNFTYQWARIDENGLQTSLNETVEENMEYNLAVAGYNILQAQLQAGTAMPAATQEQSDAYLTTIKKYDTIQRVEKNHIYKTDISIINNSATYICSVFNIVGTLVGTVSIVLYKTMFIDGEYSLLLENAVQTFNYNADGIAPTSQTLEKPIVLQPLSVIMIDNKGNRFNDTLLKACEINWTIPENSMLIAENSQDAILNYTLEEKYDINKIDNNTIQVEVVYKDHKYYAQTNFTFIKDGEPGTNGTGIVCKIVPNTEDNCVDYPMLINGQLNFNPATTNKWFKVQLWRNGIQLWDETQEEENPKVTSIIWENLINKYRTDITDLHSFTIHNNLFTYNSYQENGADIIKVTVEYDGAIYYATLPLINLQLNNTDYEIKLLKNTGFRYVMYSSDGRYPKYDNTLPFTLQVFQNINRYKEDVTNVTNNYAVNYVWSIKGQKYNGSSFEADNNLTLLTQQNNKAFYVPNETYDGENVSNAIQIDIKKDNATIGKIHIPIHFYLDRYGIAAINGWDGNSIVLNKDEGIILTPQVGAGSKNANNQFTGIVMGAVKESASSSIEQGLLGYYEGQRTLFLDAETGKANFGRTGKGQIIVDPSSNNALIYGGNYVNGTSGMLINLTDASIRWGNGKFSVDNAGNLYSTSGTIANWTITKDALTQEEGSIYLGKKKTVSINNTDKTNIIFTAGGNFGVSANGILYANSAELYSAKVSGTITAGANSKIGPWTVSNSSIYYGNANYGNVNGLYFGTSGLSLGSAFQVTAGGKVTAADITATGGLIGPWNITNTSIWYGNKNYGNANGIYLGTSGLSLGSTFQVTAAGYVTANSGKIGGWTLGSSSFYNGTNSMTSTIVGTYIGTNGFRNYYNASRYVNIQNGILTAYGASLTSATIVSATVSSSLTVGGSANGQILVKNSSGTTIVTIDNTGIKLGSTSGIIGGNGIYTNLTFNSHSEDGNGGWGKSAGRFSWVGFGYGDWGEYTDLFMTIDYTIPTGFTVDSAYVTIVHAPYVFEKLNGNKIYGYSRNIGIANARLDNQTVYFYGYENSSYGQVKGVTYDPRIANAFGSGSHTWTPSAASASRLKVDIKRSANIKNSITSAINQPSKLKIYVTDSRPSSTDDGAAKSGWAYAYLTVYGWTTVS